MSNNRLLTEDLDPIIQEGGGYLVQEGFGCAIHADPSITSATLSNQTDLGICQALSVATLTPDLSTEIPIFATLVAVSNVVDATITTSIDFRIGDVYGLVTEAGDRLVAEGTSDQFLSGNPFSASPDLSANLGIAVGFNADLQASASVSPDLSTQINLVFSASGQATTTAALSAAVTMAASIASDCNIVGADLYVYRIEPVYSSRTKKIFLAEIEAYNPETASTKTWRFASGAGYNNSGTWYDPRIENPATFSRSMGGNQLGTRQSSSYGELTLVNADGGINGMSSEFFDGRTLTLKCGDPAANYASFTTILKASIETVALERERVSVRIRDRSSVLDTPFSSVKYAGNNPLPDGFEGTADDIGGQSKPRIFGRIALMPPVLVNTSKLIYQVNDGAIDSIVNVFDNGAYLTRATDYSSSTDMLANAPLAGTYRAYPAGGYFRLGTSAFGQLSVCVVEKWNFSSCTASNIILRILTEKGLTSADWVAADFVALSQRNASSLGVVVNQDETTASLIDRICESIGAWWGFDSLNRFRVARFDGPASSPVAVITHDEMLELERETDAVFPLWQVTVKADQNYLVQDKKGLAGSVTDVRANWFSQETRDQKTEDTAVQSLRLLSTTQEGTSLMNGISQAKAESSRRLSLFSVRRDTVNMTVTDPAGTLSSLDLGSTVLLQTDFLGYSSGRKMVITSIAPDYQANTLDIKVWG